MFVITVKVHLLKLSLGTKKVMLNSFVITEFDGILFFVRLAIPPIAMCVSLATIIGSGMIFMTAVIYGMQVLGKK